MDIEKVQQSAFKYGPLLPKIGTKLYLALTVIKNSGAHQKNVLLRVFFIFTFWRPLTTGILLLMIRTHQGLFLVI
uniref:Uncharacterized protein n=1 Tax=Klebsiella pneumoniae TaxID=573 RepID=A0A8B0SNW9_KLEPN|nr:hypothetical protein [Klebsiella pneumoniae]